MTDSLNSIQKEAYEDTLGWFGEIFTNDLAHAVLALCGECGEVANLVKKIQRGSLDLNENTRSDLIEEMTDVFIYVIQIFNVLRANVGDSYDIKRAINAERFGEPL